MTLQEHVETGFMFASDADLTALSAEAIRQFPGDSALERAARWAAFALLGKEHVRRGSGREGEKQANDLLAAGWRFELPDVSDPEVWQWYWRAPPKRAGGKGRKYLSTNQAWNALQRLLAEARP